MYLGHSNAVVVGVVSFDCAVVCWGGDGSGLAVVVMSGDVAVAVAVGAAATVTVGAIMLFIVVLLA